MKPFKQCPGCQGRLVRVSHSALWFEEYCINIRTSNCKLNYQQFFSHSFEDQELRYVRLSTKRYNINYYCKDNYKIEPNTLMAYYQTFPRGEYVMPPFLKLFNYILDMNKIDELDNKLHLLNKFI